MYVCMYVCICVCVCVCVCVRVCVEKWLNTQNVDLKMNNDDDEFIQIIVQNFI